jgi:hypothetical protein
MGGGSVALVDDGSAATTWNHLQTLGAPCIEVAAVKTSIGASGTRIPRLNPSEFDIGLARIVEWFVLGDCL